MFNSSHVISQVFIFGLMDSYWRDLRLFPISMLSSYISRISSLMGMMNSLRVTSLKKKTENQNQKKI